MTAILQNEIFIQGIGFVGLFVILYVFQCKSYGKMIFWKMAGEAIFGFQYLLLGAYTGMATNFASVFTNFTYKKFIDRGKSTKPVQIIFSFMFVIIGLLSWHGPISILAIVAKVLSTASCGTNSAKLIRYTNVMILPLWLIYDIAVGSLSGSICDILNILSLGIAILRLDLKLKKSGEN